MLHKWEEILDSNPNSTKNKSFPLPSDWTLFLISLFGRVALKRRSGTSAGRWSWTHHAQRCKDRQASATRRSGIGVGFIVGYLSSAWVFKRKDTFWTDILKTQFLWCINVFKYRHKDRYYVGTYETTPDDIDAKYWIWICEYLYI